LDEKLSNIFEKICIEKQGSIHEEKEKDAFDHRCLSTFSLLAFSRQFEGGDNRF